MSEKMTIQCPNCGYEFALNEAFVEHFEQEKQDAVSQALEKERQKTQEEREELERKFDEKRNELIYDAQQQAEEDFLLRLEAKDEELKRLGKELRDLERRTRQVSVELQGEALESYLKDLLEYAFPLDSISDVQKGHSGADLIHEVINNQGQRCGIIVWEAKNTKHWNDDWLTKVKEDASRVNAEIKVIVSVALPDPVRTFDLIDGVWVTSVDAAPALGRVLRENLLQMANLARAIDCQEGKMEQIYYYLTSTTFRDRIQRIVETWECLKNQIDKEERAMKRQWSERRKQLNAMINVTTELYTDFSSIIGQQMPQVEGISMPLLEEGEEYLEG
jgi:hypothetical protein